MSVDYSTDDRSSIKEATRDKPGVKSKRWSIEAPCWKWRRAAHRKDLQEVASWTGSHVMRNPSSEPSKQKGCSDVVWKYVAGKAARFLVYLWPCYRQAVTLRTVCSTFPPL